MTLGKGSDYGLAVIKKTKSVGHLNGLLHRSVAMLTKKNKTSDVSAEIELDSELKKIQFRMANYYYNLVVTVIARYKVTKIKTELIKIMAKKVSSSMYAKIVIKHLNKTSTSHYSEEICREISEMQRLKKATRPGSNNGGQHNNKEKVVQLISTDGYRFQGVCGHHNK